MQRPKAVLLGHCKNHDKKEKNGKKPEISDCFFFLVVSKTNKNGGHQNKNSTVRGHKEPAKPCLEAGLEHGSERGVASAKMRGRDNAHRPRKEEDLTLCSMPQTRHGYSCEKDAENKYTGEKIKVQDCVGNGVFRRKKNGDREEMRYREARVPFARQTWRT